jgi:hypothetical protein
MKTQLFILAFLFITVNAYSQNNIVISDESSHTADESAVLDIYSISKGMLVPRLTDAQMSAISNPATGLLVFNTDANSFYFYNGSSWNDLSATSGTYWSQNGTTGDVYLDDLDKNVGIGTDDPISKLAVVAGSGANPDDPLFEIRDEHGEPLFSVTSEGARFYVKNDSKGISGGFAVSKYGAAKDFPDTSYLMVTPDSTRVFTAPGGKAVTGGFAVGKYGSAKGPTTNFMQITEGNYLIGHRAGDSLTTGLYNIFLGYESGISAESSSNNVFLGHLTGHSNVSGSENVFIGNKSGYSMVGGYDNIFIGNLAGENSTGATHSTFIGNEAGKNLTGDDNICIGDRTGSNGYVTNHEAYGTTIIGIDAGRNITGDYNLILGYGAGSSWGG